MSSTKTTDAATNSLGPVELLGKPKRVDHLGLVVDVIDRLGIADCIDQRVPPHPDREISVGTCVEALILAILSGSHTLYRVAEVLKPWDLGLLLGYSDLEAADFDDARLGRALDALFKAGLSAINTDVMLAAMRQYQLNTDLLHFDTTSISVHGSYDDSVPGDPEDPDGAPHVTYGYSRDKRPDLKQVLYGLTVTNDGYVPILGRITDGNRSDGLENRFNLTRLSEVMPDPTALTLTADCKLFSGENLQLAKDFGINIVTLMPRNMGAWEEAFAALKDSLAGAPVLREEVEIETVEDEETGEVTTTETVLETWRGRSVEVTHSWSGEGGEQEIELRALVVMSTQLEKKKRRTLERARDKEAKALDKLRKRFSKEAFGCAEDAAKEATKALKKRWRFHHCEFVIVEQQEREKRARPGRPKKGETPRSRTVYKVSLRVTEPEGRFEGELLRESSFVLVTLPGKKVTDVELLDLYKGQSGIEAAFRWTKVAAEVAPIFLKTPERIAALGLIYVFSLMVYALIQRQIRRALAEHEATIPGNRGRTAKPTTEVVFRLLEGITSLPVRTATGEEFYYLDDVTTEQAAALAFLGCDLLELDHVRARIIEPQRGQRGYRPPPPEDGDGKKRPRPKRKKKSRKRRCCSPPKRRR